MRIGMSGIQIEPFKITWVQLLVAAAFVGGYGASMVTVIANQSNSTEAINRLDSTLTKVNDTLIQSETERKQDRLEIRRVESMALRNTEINNLQNQDILQLQIVTGVKK